MVVANFSNSLLQNLNVGFPRGGRWKLLFNSGAVVYDSSFINGNSFDTEADAGGKDGMNFNGNVSLGPYSALIYAQ